MDPVDLLVSRNIERAPQITTPMQPQEQQGEQEGMQQGEQEGMQQGEQSSRIQRYLQQIESDKANTPYNRVKSGLQKSSASIVLGFGPTAADLKARGIQNPDFILDLLESVGEVVGDIPTMAGGGAAGGVAGPLGSAAGAFAAPTLIKSIYKEYLDHIEGGEKITFAKFLKSLGAVSKDTAIAGAEGATIGLISGKMLQLVGTEKFAKLFNAIPGGLAVAKATAPAVVEATALTGIGALSGGDLSPTAFAHNMAIILGFKASHKLLSKAKEVLEGKPPAEAAAIVEEMKAAGDEKGAQRALVLAEEKGSKAALQDQLPQEAYKLAREELKKETKESEVAEEKSLSTGKENLTKQQAKVSKEKEALQVKVDEHERILIEKAAERAKNAKKALEKPTTPRSLKQYERALGKEESLREKRSDIEDARRVEVSKANKLFSEEQSLKKTIATIEKRFAPKLEKGSEATKKIRTQQLEKQTAKYKERLKEIEGKRDFHLQKSKELLKSHEASEKVATAERQAIEPFEKELLKLKGRGESKLQQETLKKMDKEDAGVKERIKAIDKRLEFLRTKCL